MATKKAAAKKTASTGPASEKAAVKSTPVKAAVKKTAAKKTAAAEQPSGAAPGTKAARPQPIHHDIAVHAYLLWERDGHPHGQHEDYWHRAERELKG